LGLLSETAAQQRFHAFYQGFSGSPSSWRRLLSALGSSS